MATLIHFEKTRIDKIATKDHNRPALTMVYIDLARSIMYATNGYMLAVNKVKVNHDEDDGVPEIVGIPHSSMTWLLGSRGPKLTLAMRVVDGLVVVWCGPRQIAVPKEATPPPVGEIALSVAELDLEAVICLNVRYLARLADAMEQPYMAIGFSKPSSPLLIATKKCAGVLMPWLGDKTDKWIEDGKTLLKAWEDNK